MHTLAETIFNEFSELGQFLAQNIVFYDENPGFSDFFDLSPTLNSSKKNSTKPISKNLYVLKSYRSNSFISAILAVQSKIKVPHDAHL